MLRCCGRLLFVEKQDTIIAPVLLFNRRQLVAGSGFNDSNPAMQLVHRQRYLLFVVADEGQPVAFLHQADSVKNGWQESGEGWIVAKYLIVVGRQTPEGYCIDGNSPNAFQMFSDTQRMNGIYAEIRASVRGQERVPGWSTRKLSRDVDLEVSARPGQWAETSRSPFESSGCDALLSESTYRDLSRFRPTGEFC